MVTFHIRYVSDIFIGKGTTEHPLPKSGIIRFKGKNYRVVDFAAERRKMPEVYVMDASPHAVPDHEIEEA